MKLFEYQLKAVSIIQGILKANPGAILRMDEGLGKTHIAADISRKFNKTLWVCPARTKKDLQKKIAMQTDDVTLISYHMFAKHKKGFGDYDLIVFDECHHLRNWSASWTKRFCRITGSRNKFLFLSATPATKDVTDFKYVMRKCGCFWDYVSMKDVYLHYFSARPSKYGDFLEMGAFVNQDDFVSRLDLVTYDLTKKDADEDLIPPVWHVVDIPVEPLVPKNITEETKIRLKNGGRKIPDALEKIQDIIKKKGIKKSLILFIFHDNATKFASEFDLDYKLALDAKEVQENFERLKTEDYHLITTMGLTNASLDLNECDNVFVVESTYSFPLDRQSISRCHRIGKRSELNVYYLVMEGEATLRKAIPRAQLLDMKAYGELRIRPSSLKTLEKCPGSHWIKGEPNIWVAPYAFFGTQAHAAVERYLTNPKIIPSKSLSPGVLNCIEFCRDLMSKADMYGVESEVKLTEDCYGTCDFWATEWGGKHLVVLDYKNGNTPVEVNDNLQLWAYAVMVVETHKLRPETLELIIWQKNEKKSLLFDGSMIQLFKERILKIRENIMIAKKNPLAHLAEGSCDRFCKAHEIHQRLNRRRR